jgi:ring-1,2-phenylacetyl-CoA epoxidase subunit PaaD
MVIRLPQGQEIDDALYMILDAVSDPEIPVLSIVQMGVVRKATLEDGIAQIEITPTYSGCPAMDVIGEDVRKALAESGYESEVKLVLSPPWTTDWLTEQARAALFEYGIAPPLQAEADKAVLSGQERLVVCPQCKSRNTKMISPFGSTACKALFQCLDCLEPFDYFKCLK